MSITLVLVIIVVILCLGAFIVMQTKHFRIRKTGVRVMARVIQVRSWEEGAIKDFSIQSRQVPFTSGRRYYEITAEWTDPESNEKRILTSGRKKDLPSYREGDYLPAYISPKGNYLEL